MSKTVMLVEDDAALRLACRDILTAAGYVVMEVEDAAQGLEKAPGREPDLILLDIQTPNMSGFDMLRRLRKSGKWGARVPVIFFTNITPSSKEEREDVSELGPVDYLIKGDTKITDLPEKIQAVIGS